MSAPHSDPVTGALDAFEWRVPLSATSVGGKAEALRAPAEKLPAPVPPPAETSLAPQPGAQ